MIPVVFLPSQVRTTVRSLRLVAFGPNSPYQVPVNGCPSCATTETVTARIINKPIKLTDFALIQPPNLPSIEKPALRDESIIVVDLCLSAKHQLRAVII